MILPPSLMGLVLFINLTLLRYSYSELSFSWTWSQEEPQAIWREPWLLCCRVNSFIQSGTYAWRENHIQHSFDCKDHLWLRVNSITCPLLTVSSLWLNSCTSCKAERWIGTPGPVLWLMNLKDSVSVNGNSFPLLNKVSKDYWWMRLNSYIEWINRNRKSSCMRRPFTYSR